MEPTELRDAVVSRARALGFHRVGVSEARPPARYDAYLAWLEAGFHGEMAYMAADDHRAARADLERVAAGARSIVCVAMAYDHADPSPWPTDVPRGRIARYARGRDYHGLLKERLYELAAAMRELTGEDVAARPATDSAPLLERELAERAGLGFVGKNTMLITPGLGSYTVLGELLTVAELAPTAPTQTAHCGECRACLDACPTGAFSEPFVLDARRCISYLTIEHRGAIPPTFRAAIGDMVFGCDICQDVCPYNAAAPARTQPDEALRARDLEHVAPDLVRLATMGSNPYKRFTDDSALRRATRRGLQRNTAIALGNSGDLAAIAPLARLLGGADELVVEHAAWALEALARSIPPANAPGPFSLRPYEDRDWPVLREIHDLSRILELAASGLVPAFLTLDVTAEPEGLMAGEVLVAESADTVRGFVAFRKTDGEHELTWLYVHPASTRRGIARALVRAVIEHADGPIEVEALAENSAVIALYESEGFAVIDRISGRLEGNETFAAQGVRMRRE